MGGERSTRALALALVALTGCGGPGDAGDVPLLETATQPLAAVCVAAVDGSGDVDVETDYLPHVIACENGGADFAALQAQAVAARSYLYYKIGREGRIGDGQGEQVYSCGRGPGQEHIDAASSTAGQVLTYHDAVIAAFYVAGAIPSTDDCRPGGGDRDPTGTEHFVTYNEGRSGDGIEQTTLGWVNPGNWANRGCKSQNGANCLSEHGYVWEDIVRFYYGEDIGIVQAEGPCVAPVAPPPPPPDPDAAPPPPPPPDPDAAPPPPPPLPTPDAAVSPDAAWVESDAEPMTPDAAPPTAPPTGPVTGAPTAAPTSPAGFVDPRREANFEGAGGCGVSLGRSTPGALFGVVLALAFRRRRPARRRQGLAARARSDSKTRAMPCVVSASSGGHCASIISAPSEE